MNFAIRIVKFYKYLTEEKKVFVLSKQLLRSGTGAGSGQKTAQYWDRGLTPAVGRNYHSQRVVRRDQPLRPPKPGRVACWGLES